MKRSSSSPVPSTSAAPARLNDDAGPVSHEGAPGDAVRLQELELRCSELQAERDALSELVAMLGDAVVCTTLDGTVTYWNESASRMLGGTAQDWLGRSLFDWFPRIEMVRLFALQQAALGGQAQMLEWQDERNTGTYLSVGIRLARGGDGARSPARIVNIFRDVTERRSAEAALRRDAQVLRQLQDASPEVPVPWRIVSSRY